MQEVHELMSCLFSPHRPASGHRLLRGTGAVCALALVLAAPADSAAETPARAGGTALSPFGIGACNQTSQELEKWIPQMEEIGLHVMRTFRSNWDAVEPEEGKWNWPLVDRQTAYLTGHHFEYGGLLYGGVRWNTKDKGGTLPVNNLPAWSNYVSEL